jgi:GNAT superfamily N-acetyltransferase
MLVRLIWPPMAGHCRVELTDGSSASRKLFLLDALVRGRSVARTALHQGFALPEYAAQWWISGAYTAPLYRRRGLNALLLYRALEVAWEQGAPEVFAAIAQSNLASQALFRRAGFRPVEDLSIGEALDAHFRRKDPGAEPLVVFSAKAGEEPPPA